MEFSKYVHVTSMWRVKKICIITDNCVILFFDHPKGENKGRVEQTLCLNSFDFGSNKWHVWQRQLGYLISILLIKTVCRGYLDFSGIRKIFVM